MKFPFLSFCIFSRVAHMMLNCDASQVCFLSKPVMKDCCVVGKHRAGWPGFSGPGPAAPSREAQASLPWGSCCLFSQVKHSNPTWGSAPVPLNQGSLTGDKSKSPTEDAPCQHPRQSALQWGIIYATWNIFDTNPLPKLIVICVGNWVVKKGKPCQRRRPLRNTDFIRTTLLWPWNRKVEGDLTIRNPGNSPGPRLYHPGLWGWSKQSQEQTWVLKNHVWFVPRRQINARKTDAAVGETLS